MSAQQGGLQQSLPLQETLAATSTSGNQPTRTVPQPGTQRITGKLLATQGYVVGIEISGSGARQSVALADLNGTILHHIPRPLEDVPDANTVLRLIDECSLK